MSKEPTSFRLSKEAKHLLTRIAKRLGVSRASTLELVLREKALSLNLDLNQLDDNKDKQKNVKT